MSLLNVGKQETKPLTAFSIQLKRPVSLKNICVNSFFRYLCFELFHLFKFLNKDSPKPLHSTIHNKSRPEIFTNSGFTLNGNEINTSQANSIVITATTSQDYNHTIDIF